jgi:hypothetical protein
MSDPQPSRSDRRLSRRRPPRGKTLLICQKGLMGLGPNLAVTIIDMSETGLRVALSVELPRRQEVSLVIEGVGMPKAIKRHGTVIWTAANTDGTFTTGIQFQKRLGYVEFLGLV